MVWCYGSLSGLTDVQNHLYKTCFLLIPNNNSNACLQSQALFWVLRGYVPLLLPFCKLEWCDAQRLRQLLTQGHIVHGGGVTCIFAFSSGSLAVFSTCGLAQPKSVAAQNFTTSPNFSICLMRTFCSFHSVPPRATFTDTGTSLHHRGWRPWGIQCNIPKEMKSPKKATSDMRGTEEKFC